MKPDAFRNGPVACAAVSAFALTLCAVALAAVRIRVSVCSDASRAPSPAACATLFSSGRTFAIAASFSFRWTDAALLRREEDLDHILHTLQHDIVPGSFDLPTGKAAAEGTGIEGRTIPVRDQMVLLGEEHGGADDNA